MILIAIDAHIQFVPVAICMTLPSFLYTGVGVTTEKQLSRGAEASWLQESELGLSQLCF